MKKDEVWLKKSRLANPLIAFYFFIAFVDVIAEFNKDFYFVGYTKPAIIPVLMILYWITTQSINKWYLTALLLAVVSSLFLISNEISWIICGSLFLFLSQIAVVSVIMQKIKFPGSILISVSALPFFCLCFLVAVLVYDKIGIQLLLFGLQSLMIMFFGGVTLANYLTKYSRANSQLLISASSLSISQLLVVLGGTFTESKLILPLSTISFVLGHYLLYKYVLSQDKRNKRYKIIN